MSNPIWPASLPQDPYQDGPSIEPASNALRTQMDAGPAKMRRRYTAVPETVKFNLILSESEWATLDTFVRITIQDVLPFDWKDFTTGAAATYRFTKRPTRTWYGDDLWTVSFELEKLP